ncbi:MAG: Nif3-like dinuclear metal center hexameric protein [Chromatiaceae bacterium]|jgi:dinuclear metal center YbgI/SA1388 family protein|nr:Nif3-like dinuclear metal center hexameric protein [Chromatiaceae bacterium]
MAELKDIVAYCDQRLDTGAFDDYCPNGLQVEGREQVASIVSGVTASQALVDAAVAHGADLLLVHHGYFWRGEPAPLVGMKGRRVRALMASGLSLLAYHLPLDAHPELGNNRQLGLILGFADAAPVDGLLWGGELNSAISAGDLASRVASALGRAPLAVGPDNAVRRIAWCTGAAQGMIEQAAARGFDAFISGEIAEHTVHQARELGILYLAAGHHATERYGVQALGSELSERFRVAHRFIDVDNPV